MSGFSFFSPLQGKPEQTRNAEEYPSASPGREDTEANLHTSPGLRRSKSPVYSPTGLNRRVTPHGLEGSSATPIKPEFDRLQAFLDSGHSPTVPLAGVGYARSTTPTNRLVTPVSSGTGRNTGEGTKGKSPFSVTPKDGHSAASASDSHPGPAVSVNVGHAPMNPSHSPREDMPQVGGQVKTSAAPRSHQAGNATTKAWGVVLNTITESSSTEEKSKKWRPHGAGWTPTRGVEALQETVRWGARALADSIMRKRSPLSLRLLLALILTGFVTVMLSYRSLSPSSLSKARDEATDMLILQDLIAKSTQPQPSGALQGQGHLLSAGLGRPIGEAGELTAGGTQTVGPGRALSGLTSGQPGLVPSSIGAPSGVQAKNSQAHADTAPGTLSSFFAAFKPKAANTGGGGASWGGQVGEAGLPARLLGIPEHQRKLWLPVKSHNLGVCIDRPKKHKEPYPYATNGYLIVTANGGLNQMRAAICDMVAVARIMNVTLVVPQLDHSSFWADPSDFEDIFQLDHFINELKLDIRIAKELPPSHQQIKPLEIFPVSWSPFSYYRKDLLKKLKKHRVMVFPLTDSRLANNNLPESIQRLRCRANYRALKYTPQIEAVASSLVERLRAKGPYIALHLRYEKDMLAFTGCTHGLTADEGEELRVMRYNNSRWKEKQIDGEQRRQEGLCPLTPGETALFLKALGFPNTSVIYIAAGDIYGSRGLEDLTRVYPNTFTHATLATAEELESLEKYQNRMAAVDYTVAVESDVFVYTYEGNMARAVQGHRRFEGHRKTIMPDRRLVVQYIDMFRKGLRTWSQTRQGVKQSHRDRLGAPHLRLTGMNPKNEENFFANPYPGCICEGQPTASF